MSNKVLQVNFSKGWGGGEEYICALVKGLEQKGQLVDLLVQASSKSESQFRSKLSQAINILTAKNNLKHLSSLIDIFQQYQVIHFHREHDLWIVPFIKLFCPKAKVIFTKHIPSKHFHIGNLLCNIIIANSLFVEKSLKQFYPRANIKLIYPSIQIPSFDPDQELLALDGNPSLLMGASFYKNQDEMIEIFSLLIEFLPEAQLYLSSGSNDEADKQTIKLKNLITKHNLEKKVHLLCCVPRDEYLELIRRANLFVYTYEKEPFGYVLLEAAVMDSLIVAYKGGGGEEILSKHKNTLLLEPRDKEGFIKAIIQQAQQLPRKKQFNQKFYDYFSLEYFLTEHLNLYT